MSKRLSASEARKISESADNIYNELMDTIMSAVSTAADRGFKDASCTINCRQFDIEQVKEAEKELESLEYDLLTRADRSEYTGIYKLKLAWG